MENVCGFRIMRILALTTVSLATRTAHLLGQPNVGKYNQFLRFKISSVLRQILLAGLLFFPILNGYSGKVTSWGNDGSGAIVALSDITNIVTIAAGGGHSLLVLSDGTLIGTGANYYGQTNVPAGLSNIVSVAAGQAHSLALRNDGTVIGWGWDSDGQASIPVGLTNVVAISAGPYDSVALGGDGTITAWGLISTSLTPTPVGLTNLVAIAEGQGFRMVLRSDGKVIAWGFNGYGETNVPNDLSNVVAIAAGYNFGMALKSDGTVAVWGGTSGQTNVPTGLTQVVAIAGGDGQCLVVQADGSVVAWGQDYMGNAEVPLGLSNVVSVAGGGYFSLALSGNMPPWITTPMLPQTVVAGSAATFNVNAVTYGYAFFQWNINGNAITGETNRLLSLNNVQMNVSGSYYSATVSNAVGSAMSSNATLTVVHHYKSGQPNSVCRQQCQFLSGLLQCSTCHLPMAI